LIAEYNVDTFTDAREALKHFLEVRNNQNKKSDYDPVITDIRMPGLNGIQLYQILKALDLMLKVLFISALDSAQEIISVLPNVKLSHIIRKPIEANELVQIMKDNISSIS
jgi:DNA-binding response OmpR family regulator